jgi:peptide deformylase
VAVLSVARMGHPVLLKPSTPVADPTAENVVKLAADTQETIEDCGANGIAGPQVYAPLRVVVYRFAAHRIPPGSSLKPVPWTVMINPEITGLDDGADLYWERCLSIPAIHGKVPRHSRIGIRYLTPQGRTEEREVLSLHAALLQHEVDHLDGVLYPMRMKDHSTLAFNTDPGLLSQDAAKTEGLDPLMKKLADAWPVREKWQGYLP